VKSLSKKNQFDKYYTCKKAVDSVYAIVDKYWKGERFLEPSAGEGVFYRNGYFNYLMYDIDPKVKGIIEADFLKIDPLEFKGCFAVGNPPFGFCGKLAVKFINHCANTCDKICFILPNTFKKELFFDKHLNKHLHLVEVAELPKNSFVLHGGVYDVPCSIFYIEKRTHERPDIEIKSYLVPDESSNLFVRRVGGKAGKLVDSFNKNTTYKVSSGGVFSVKYYLERYADEIRECASNTAGVRSITLDEINLIITRGEEYK